MSAAEDASADAGNRKAGGSAIPEWNVGPGRLPSGGNNNRSAAAQKRALRAQSETLASVSARATRREADSSDSDSDDGDDWNTGGGSGAGVAEWNAGGVISSLPSAAAAARSAPRKAPAGRGQGRGQRRRSVCAEGALSLNVTEFLQGMDGHSARTRALHDSGLFGNLGDSAAVFGGDYGSDSDDSSLEKFDDSLSSLPFISPSFARTAGAGPKSVRDLVERRKWMKLLKVLQTPEGREQVRASCGGGGAATAASSGGDEEEKLPGKSHDYATYDGTALHHAASRGAPLKVVCAVDSAGGPALWSGGDSPEAKAKGGEEWRPAPVDSAGRTALHAAAASTIYNPSGVNGGAVVSYLIRRSAANKNPAAAVLLAADAGGRTPLHLACMNRPDDGPGQANAKAARRLSPSVVRALADAAPAAVRAEDGSGLTPLDYAVAAVTGARDVGKFRPEGKASLTVLSEPAIFPMVPHCHGLFSERSAAAEERGGDQGNMVAGIELEPE